MPMNCCPHCGKEYAPHSAMCPPCNYWFKMPPVTEQALPEYGYSRRQIAALAGAVLGLAGLFTPLVGVPFFSVNYYSLTQFSGLAGFGFFLLLVCGIGSIALGLTRRYEMLRWSGLASLLIIACTFFVIRSTISEARTEMEKSMESMPDVSSSPFKGMGEAFMSMIQMQWGWGVLVVGAALLLAAGMMKDE